MLSHNESVILFGLIWGCAMTVYLLVKIFVGKGKEASLRPWKQWCKSDWMDAGDGKDVQGRKEGIN